MLIFSLLGGVEVGDALDSTCAYGAEVLHLIDLHAAFLCGSVATLALIAGAFEHTHHLGGFVQSRHCLRVVLVHLLLYLCGHQPRERFDVQGCGGAT